MRNTSQIGENCVVQVMAAVMNQNPERLIWLPFGDSKRFDFVVEEPDGRFVKIQCKTARLTTNGAVWFPTCSIDSRSVKGRCIRKGYQGQIDFFGAYCPETGKSYLVPIEDVTSNYFHMRIDPPRNNQVKGIHWARDYEIGTAPEVGEYSGLSVSGSVVKIIIDN